MARLRHHHRFLACAPFGLAAAPRRGSAVVRVDPRAEGPETGLVGHPRPRLFPQRASAFRATANPSWFTCVPRRPSGERSDPSPVGRPFAMEKNGTKCRCARVAAAKAPTFRARRPPIFSRLSWYQAYQDQVYPAYPVCSSSRANAASPWQRCARRRARGRDCLQLHQEAVEVGDGQPAHTPFGRVVLQATRHLAQGVDIETGIDLVEDAYSRSDHAQLHHFGALALTPDRSNSADVAAGGRRARWPWPPPACVPATSPRAPLRVAHAAPGGGLGQQRVEADTGHLDRVLECEEQAGTGTLPGRPARGLQAIHGDGAGCHLGAGHPSARRPMSLPEPLGPMITWTSPLRTVRSMPCKTSLPPADACKPRTSNTWSVLTAAPRAHGRPRP